MGFLKTMGAAICAQLTLNLAKMGLEKLENHIQEYQDRRNSRFEERESIYSGKKNHSGPYARKIGFGEQN